VNEKGKRRRGTKESKERKSVVEKKLKKQT
jgi:hypothetical protein